MAQMDLAGAVLAVRRAKGRVATVAVDAMSFHRPVYVGDLVSCYATIKRVGRTSMTIDIATWVERRQAARLAKGTEGMFHYGPYVQTERRRQAGGGGGGGEVGRRVV